MRIVFEDLSLEVARGVRALDAVSGEIPEGSVTAVIGPSGAGKSSLMNVLAGLASPDAGRVTFEGEDVTSRPPEARALGIVFQDLRLFPFLTARGNVAFGPKVAGVPRPARDARVEEALRLTRADAFADRPVRVLSGGEKQRVALARALAMHPRGLLLDEPFGALDAELRRGLRDELRELIARLGLTTILVTHDRDDAFALASRVIVLRQGRVEQTGTLAECYRRPKNEYVATLLGEATILEVSGREGDLARVGPARIPVEPGTDGGRIVLRPEDFELSDVASPDSFRGRVVDARFGAGHWRLVLEILPGVRLVAHVDEPPAGGEIAVRPRRPQSLTA